MDKKWFQYFCPLYYCTLRLLVKNSMAPSAVTSKSPYLLRVPDSPPKAKGSRGTGMPTLTPAATPHVYVNVYAHNTNVTRISGG